MSLESVRADHTPMYGYERNTTPRIQELANQPDSNVLDNGIAQSLWTPAVSASMLTGTYLSTHHVGQDGKAEERLPSTIKTLPELLRKSGYETALFSPNPYISEATGLDKGFDYIKSVKAVPESYSPLNPDARDYWLEGVQRLMRSRVLRPERAKKELKTTENEVLERHVRRWLTSSDRRADSFFVYAHIPSPHHPYLPNQDYLRSFADDIEFSAEEAFSLVKDVYYGGSESLNRRIANGPDFSEEEWSAIKAMYDATLRHMDDTVGNLIEYARSVSDDLILVIVGDHGELFGEAGVLGHNLVLHDNLIRIPIVTSGIEGVETNQSTFTQQIDLSYTIASITDVLIDQFEGRDIRNNDREYALSQRGETDFTTYVKHDESFKTDEFFKEPYTAVRTEDYKLKTNSERTELYELPDEETDVSAKHSKKIEELSDILKTENIQWTHQPSQGRSDFSEAQLDQLKDLGYIS